MQLQETKKTKTTIKELAYNYRHVWVLFYGVIYLTWFAWLEQTVTKKFHIITMPVDLKIPFCEYFIIPYLLWFLYITFGVIFFFFRNKQDYYKICAFLFTGMTVFLIVSTIYPNGHYLRPQAFERENLCTELVRWLYQTDTPTNLFPSIHVYNSLGVHIALTHSAYFKDKKICRMVSFVLCVSIILSTMFLKQHSVFDVLTAFGMAAVMYYVIYREAYKKVLVPLRAGKPEKKQVLHDLRL
ncbi:MAG: phosphatase PAP2 family protein [Eubacterium sp.]|nr:phosphatase PAP2 family protein [Eubacterium sp.]